MLAALLLAVTACGGGDGDGPAPEEPDLYNVGDYVMLQCQIEFHTPGGWDSGEFCEIVIRPNQPVFTALDDCLIAKGHEQDDDPTVWDDSQEDRDRGWAWMVVCAPVVEG